MEPFVHLEEYPFVICKACRFACVANEVPSHLKEWHTSVTPKERRRIAAEVGSIEGIARDQAGLASFALPPPTTDPIPFIAAPENDGLRCEAISCQYVARTERGMREHYRTKHGWTSSRKRGLNIDSQSVQARAAPWTTGVRCQRFFRSRIASGWFEVGRSSETVGSSGMFEDMAERVMRIHQDQAKRFETRAEDDVRVASDKTEPNGWLDRAGWAKHLIGLSPPRLRATAIPVGGEELALHIMCESLDRVLGLARAACTSSKVGTFALFEVARKHVQTKPRRPFDNRMEDDSWGRYRDTWRRILCILHRTQMGDAGDRPPYCMTRRQKDVYAAFAVGAKAKSEGANLANFTNDRADELCLEMAISWLDHQMKQGEYDNCMLSGLAVMGMREDGGWVDAVDYTTHYSAVIKVARMLVVYHSYLQREGEVKRLMRTIDEDDAREEATSIFSIVRRNVQRFMTTIPDKRSALPTPMDWIYDVRAYGMKIRYTTPAGGTIDWEGDRIKYRQISFTMDQLFTMLHALVDEARRLLAELTAVEEEGIDGLPPIEWSRLEDDHSEDRVGYSFLHDARNTWLSKGTNWVLQRILESDTRRRAWLTDATADGDDDNPYKANAVRKYTRTFEQFRERLWMLMHMVAGQPARSTEILGIRYVNTVNGGVRNIMAHNRMMCFVTSYHKNFRAKGDAKVIHRYLPREIGELLVWYSWLALPFWQQVQGIVKQADNRSPFLWSDEVVSRTEKETETERREREKMEREEPEPPRTEPEEEQANREANPEDDVPDTPGFRDWIKERKWTSDRARRIIQRHSERLMATRLTISAWRHMAIGISNRFLNEAFQEDGFGDEDVDGVADNPADLQAGHGTHAAGMIYARELQQSGSGTAAQREQFRKVSRQWHRFWGFGADDTVGAGRGRAIVGKRQRDPFQAAREEARYRRFAQLHQVDIRGKLRMMMGDSTEFRGQQEQVIRAIIRGESPILQIAGTGGGKSLSFMLPAYCSPDGTTIVIVPLTTLRQDLHGRCEKDKIDSYMWKSGESHPVATTVFVTPESAMTKEFGDFVNRLQCRQVLDRVVVDECHVLLDATPKFRPKYMELGRRISEWGVQMVFLTATLPPADEAEFCRIAGLSANSLRMFRSRTTRKNMAYRVRSVRAAPGKQEEAEDAKVCEIVQDQSCIGGEGLNVYAFYLVKFTCTLPNASQKPPPGRHTPAQRPEQRARRSDRPAATSTGSRLWTLSGLTRLVRPPPNRAQALVCNLGDKVGPPQLACAAAASVPVVPPSAPSPLEVP